MNRKGVTAPLSCLYSAKKAQLLKLLDFSCYSAAGAVEKPAT